jgi:lambda family phage tail tape measure protein
MATTNASINIAVNGQQQLERLQRGLDRVTGAFGGLKTQLAGLGFAALGRSAILAADGLSDLSTSTGMAVGRLVELRNAIEDAGGEVTQMPAAINNFIRSIDEAASGSLKAQTRFAALGVSLNELRTLDERALLIETLDGIGKITDSGRRATVMMDLFGKSFRNVDPKQLADQLRATAGEGDKFAESIRRAAEIQGNFEKATRTLQMTFLEAFSPMIDKVNALGTELQNSKEKLDTLITTIKIVGIALATAFAVSIGTGIVAVIGTIGRGLMSVAKLAGLATAGAGIFKATGPHMTALRGLVVLIASIGTSIGAATLLFEDFGDVVVNVAARSTEAMGNFAAEVLNFPTDAIAGLLNLMGAGIKDPVGLGTPIKMLVENARKAREEYEATVRARKDAAKPDKPTQPGTGTEGGGGRTVDTTEIDNAREKIRGLSDDFAASNQRIREQLDLDTRLVGKSKEYADMQKAQAELEKRTVDEVKKLQDLRENLTPEQRAAGLAAEYEKQIAKVKELSEEESKRIANSVKANNEALNVEQLRQFGISRQIELSKELQKLQDDIAKTGLNEIEKKYYDIDVAAREAAQSAINAAAAQRGITPDQMSIKEIQDFYAEAAKGADKLKEKTTILYNESRTFERGWKQALSEYVDDATNAATQAQRIFQKATQGMEDSIVSFAKTGKFEFKSFVNSILEELLRSQVRQLIGQLFNIGGSGGGGSKSTIGRLLGFANGGIIPTNGPVIVGERGPEIISGAAGRNVTPNNQLGGTNVTYNIQAVDASSFKQLVARDPAFLYAVTQQGAKSIPQTRR